MQEHGSLCIVWYACGVRRGGAVRQGWRGLGKEGRQRRRLEDGAGAVHTQRPHHLGSAAAPSCTSSYGCIRNALRHVLPVVWTHREQSMPSNANALGVVSAMKRRERAGTENLAVWPHDFLFFSFTCLAPLPFPFFIFYGVAKL